jgi:hypothetical protein
VDQDRIQWQIFMNTMMNLQVGSLKAGKFYQLHDCQLFKEGRQRYQDICNYKTNCNEPGYYTSVEIIS